MLEGLLKLKDSIVTIGQAVTRSLLHLAFPTKCLHCASLLPPTSLILCSECSSLLDMIIPEERCSTCFKPKSEQDFLPCQECLQYLSPYCQMAAAFDYTGPAVTLVKRLKYANQPYLAQGMAAFLVVQMERLKWPFPDALIPVPISFTQRFERGYNQSTLIAEEMSRLLGCLVLHALKCQNNYRQGALCIEQNKILTSQRFQLSTKASIQGKVLYVIDDVMSSDSALQRCGETLNQGKPIALYALTFCQKAL
jgi:ComF family protein